MRRPLPIAVAVVAAVAVTGAGEASAEVGPATGLLVSGRQLEPAGKLAPLGNFPAGGALTTNGRFLWTISAGRGQNDIRIVQVDPSGRCRRGRRGHRCRVRRARRIGRVVQTIVLPGGTGGIAMAPDGRTAYVSGSPESGHSDQKVAKDIPGKQGDVIHVFTYDARTGTASRDGVIGVPPPAGTALPQAIPLTRQIPGTVPIPQNFPPTATTPQSWPRDLAVSPDGKTLLAALNLADRAAIVDTRTRKARYVPVGSYPYGAAITRDGKRGLVSNEADGTVSVIDLASGAKIAGIPVGAHLSHPEGIAADPKSDRAYVAVANEDTVIVIDTRKLRVERRLSLAQPDGFSAACGFTGAQRCIGTAPVALTVSDDGKRLLVANSGEDAIAIFSIPDKDDGDVGKFALLGRVPVGAYPVFAGTTAGVRRLVWVAAKGVGAGPNIFPPGEIGPLDTGSATSGADPRFRFKYLPTQVFGRAGITTFPSAKRLRILTGKATRELQPTNTQTPASGTPLADPSTSSKIRHVFYVVRENRSYDQILGDDSRGEGDPSLALFRDDVTPNAHALARRFPLLDHVFANSEASIDGHFWTSAGAVSDYVNKSWHQNYGDRKRPYDFGVYAITWPSQRFLFDQAEKQGISYFNYGEAVAGTVPLADKDRNPEETQEVQRKVAKSDLGPPQGCYPNDASIGTDAVLSFGPGPDVETYDSSTPAGAPPGSLSRFDCFRARFSAQLATGSVPAFNYMVLPSDHTTGTSPGTRTPRAMVAENDYALGQVVDLVSHSSIWKSSLILVIEDDSQDGADHVDAHRIPAFAISPYAKRGAVVQTRYDFLSFIRTMELVTGMRPLNLYDALAVPLYDAFDTGPGNAEPYRAIAPRVNLTERNTASSPNARLSSRVVGRTDETPQRVLDKILWQSVHGRHSKPPPPGPNAAREEEGER